MKGAKMRKARLFFETVLSFFVSVVTTVIIVEKVMGEREVLRFLFSSLIWFYLIFSFLMIIFTYFDEHEEREKKRKLKMLKNRDITAYEKERSKIYEDIKD